MSGTKAKAPGVEFAGAMRDHQRDLRKLDKNAPAEGAHVPGIARLMPVQIFEIERMSRQGLNLDTIGIRLGFPNDVWNELIRVNPEVADAFRAGAALGQDLISDAAFRGARAGDASLIKYYLDRFGGPQFRPTQQPSVVIQTGARAVIDVDAMSARFDRQRALIDGTAEELGDDAGGPPA